MSQREFLVESNGTGEHLARAFKAAAPKLMEQLSASEVQLIGSRVSCTKWRLRARSRRGPISEPAAPTSAAESNRGGAELETSGPVADMIPCTTKSGTGF